jgi:hypothetical protein
VNFKLREMEVLLGKIMTSSLLKVQKIEVMKTFLLSLIDFLLLNGEAGIEDLQGIERKVRRMIKEDLKISGLSVECHHASWKDGDRSNPSVQDGGDVLTIRSFAQMTLSLDDGARIAMRQFIEDERRSRNIESEPEALFLTGKKMGIRGEQRRLSLRGGGQRVRSLMWC